MSHDDQKHLSRRSILNAGATVLAAVALARIVRPEFAFAQRKGAPAAPGAGEAKLVDPNDATAKGLGYVVNKSSVPKNLQIKRGTTDFAGQKCGTCAFFKGVDGKVGKDEVGQCQLITNGKVKPTSWCTSWSLKTT